MIPHRTIFSSLRSWFGGLRGLIFGSERSDLGCERRGFGSERLDLGSERPDLRSIGLHFEAGGDGQTDRPKPEKIALCGIIGHWLLRGRCPKRKTNVMKA